MSYKSEQDKLKDGFPLTARQKRQKLCKRPARKRYRTGSMARSLMGPSKNNRAARKEAARKAREQAPAPTA